MILDQIVEDKKKRLPQHKAQISEAEMRKLAEETVTRKKNCFYENLRKEGLSIIGEFKQASPSLGKITSKINLMDRIKEYNASVDAISCLTEPFYFQGSDQYLWEIASEVDIPVLRKDFRDTVPFTPQRMVIGTGGVPKVDP